MRTKKRNINVRKYFTTFTCCVFLLVKTHAQIDPTGTWLVCDTSEGCNMENGLIYIMCWAGKGQYLVSLDSRSPNSKPVGEFYYNVEGNTMTTWETTEDEDTLVTEITVNMIDKDRMSWVVNGGDTLFLFRKDK